MKKFLVCILIFCFIFMPVCVFAQQSGMPLLYPNPATQVPADIDIETALQLRESLIPVFEEIQEELAEKGDVTLTGAMAVADRIRAVAPPGLSQVLYPYNTLGVSLTLNAASFALVNLYLYYNLGLAQVYFGSFNGNVNLLATAGVTLPLLSALSLNPFFLNLTLYLTLSAGILNGNFAVPYGVFIAAGLINPVYAAVAYDSYIARTTANFRASFTTSLVTVMFALDVIMGGAGYLTLSLALNPSSSRSAKISEELASMTSDELLDALPVTKRLLEAFAASPETVHFSDEDKRLVEAEVEALFLGQ